MSNEHAPSSGNPDRRVRRTRGALTGAFVHLMHARPYGEIRMRDILERADVGRSTFYDHYRDKDDLLLHTMEPVFDLLASAARPDCDVDRLAHLFDHFEQMRPRVREFFAVHGSSPVPGRFERALSALLEPDLRAELDARGGTPSLPPELVAEHVADVLLSWVRLWVIGRARVGAATFARAAHRSVRASVAELLG